MLQLKKRQRKLNLACPKAKCNNLFSPQIMASRPLFVKIFPLSVAFTATIRRWTAYCCIYFFNWVKYPSASLESLDYDSRQIKKSTLLNLASMGFIGNATNLIITGPTGAGKTYLSCALGIEACKQTYRVLYIRMPDLMRNFENLRDNLRELTKYRRRIGNYHLLILDEWLNYKVTEKEAKILYELFEQRSGNNPTIFVGQYPVDEWHERLGGGTQADSIMDRIIHNAYEIPTSETNLRKIYDTKKLKNLIDEIES